MGLVENAADLVHNQKWQNIFRVWLHRVPLTNAPIEFKNAKDFVYGLGVDQFGTALN
jgi:hypothetical protein